MKTKSRIALTVPQVESRVRHLPLVDLLVDTRTELLELALRSGLKVFTAMLEEVGCAYQKLRTHCVD